MPAARRPDVSYRLWRACGIRPSFVLIADAILSVTSSASEVDRLARLARVWAAVEYLHPFQLEKQIDWGGALVRAIPKVRAAPTDEDFASAVGSMLQGSAIPQHASCKPGRDRLCLASPY